jgi:hypothetical protein
MPAGCREDKMRYFLDDTPEVVFAFWVGVGAFVLALLMLLTIIVMRWISVRREQRHLHILQYWRRLLVKVAKGEKVSLPKISSRNASEFAEAWNDLHDAQPASHEQLRSIGDKVGLSAAARRLLRGSYHQRALAIIAIGHQGNPRDFDHIAPLLSDPSPITSLCTARALSQIDPARAMELFVPALMARDDWPDGTVASILKENNDDSAVKELSNAILHANDNTAARLVRFLADTDAERAAPVIRLLLDSKADDHVISTCLQMVTDRTDLDRVRKLLTHPRWHVRMHAATALGRLGDSSDEARLSALLSDPQWWVRYRSAQALRSLPGVKEDGIRRIGAAQNDAFAREIIQQVLAEPIGGRA